jgi:hypothetical protein
LNSLVADDDGKGLYNFECHPQDIAGSGNCQIHCWEPLLAQLTPGVLSSLLLVFVRLFEEVKGSITIDFEAAL